MSQANNYNREDVTLLLRFYGEVVQNQSVGKRLLNQTMSAIRTLVPYLSRQTLVHWLQMFDMLMEAVTRLSLVDMDTAIQYLDIIRQLTEKKCLLILSQRFSSVIKFCLETITRHHHGDKITAKAFSLLASSIRYDFRQEIMENDLMSGVLRTVFSVMCSSCNHVDENGNTLDDLAVKVVSSMSRCTPRQQFIPALYIYVAPAFDSPYPLVRRAAFLSLSKGFRGPFCCNDGSLTPELVNNFLFPRVYSGLSDPSTPVCHSALIALGEFSEKLQPNIAVHLATALQPSLLECLRKINEEKTLSHRDISKAYRALIKICENLSKEIIPYLYDLLQFLLNIIESVSIADKVILLAMKTLRTITATAGEDLAPYLPMILISLDRFVKHPEGPTDKNIQSSAFLCLAALAEHVGGRFESFTQHVLGLGLSILKTEDNSNVRSSIYRLFGQASVILMEDMEPFLSDIVPAMINSIKFCKDKSGNGREMKQACLAVGTIAKSVDHLFLPYLQETYQEILALLEHQSSAIRAASSTSLGDLCCAVCSIEKKGVGDKARKGSSLPAILSSIVSKFISMISDDKSWRVCRDTLYSLNAMIKVIGLPVLTSSESGAGVGAGVGATDAVGALFSVLMKVSHYDIHCYNYSGPKDDDDDYDDDDDEDDDEPANHRSCLMPGGWKWTRPLYEIGMELTQHHSGRLGDDDENYNDGQYEMLLALDLLLPSLARVVSSEEFSTFFRSYIIVHDVGGECLRGSLVYGTIKVYAEVLKSMGGSAAAFVDRFYASFVEDLEFSIHRIDAVYALGVLIGNSGEITRSRYSDTLNLFKRLMDSYSDCEVVDTVCAAICRMTISNRSAVPIEDYLPVILSRLPFRCNHYDNNLLVYQCLLDMYHTDSLPESLSEGQPEGLVAKLISMAGQILDESNATRGCRAFLRNFLREMNEKEPAVVAQVLEEVNPSVRRSIKACLSRPFQSQVFLLPFQCQSLSMSLSELLDKLFV